MSTQSELALLRGKRLASGKCPEHGAVLVKDGPMLETGKPVGTRYRCPCAGCAFALDARAGTRVEKLLR